MSKRRLASVLYLLPIVLSEPAYAGGWLLPEGSYEIAFRLELPHLERWAVDKETTACVSEPNGLPGALPPILSDNNPFAGCAARNVHHNESSLTFDIVCGGRDAAKAKATYRLAPGGFRAGQGADLLETRVWDVLSDRVASYSASRSFRTAAI